MRAGNAVQENCIRVHRVIVFHDNNIISILFYEISATFIDLRLEGKLI